MKSKEHQAVMILQKEERGLRKAKRKMKAVKLQEVHHVKVRYL